MASKNWVLLPLEITALKLEYSIALMALPRASKDGWSVALGANGDLGGESMKSLMSRVNSLLPRIVKFSSVLVKTWYVR